MADLTAEELRAKLAEYATTRDPATRDELVVAHLGLAKYFARRFANRGEPDDDLVQVASLALVNAVDRFDPERGVEFSTFASSTIAGELKRHFRDRGWAVRAPRRIQELYLQLGELLNELTQTLGRSPTVHELAAAAGVSADDVLEALEAGQSYRLASLDATAPDEDGSLIDRLGEEDSRFEQTDRRMALAPLLAMLPERERLIFHLRFFEGMTQKSIADEIGISQMHVSRLLARSMATLREAAARD